MKGILFTELLYNKTVRKEKTQTRRAGKSLAKVNDSPDDWRILHSTLFTNGCLNVGFTQSKIGQDLTWHNCESNYRVGEVMYIKEPYHEDELGIVRYKYDFPEDNEWRNRTKFKNKMFVGADKARAYIRITDVKIERLFDISDEDCLKEGVEPYKDLLGLIEEFPNYMHPTYHNSMRIGGGHLLVNKGQGLFFGSAKESYFSLFRFANNYPHKKEIPNLWVWVYDYVLCDKEGNEL